MSDIAELSPEEEKVFLDWWFKNKSAVISFANQNPDWESRRLARCAWKAALKSKELKLVT